MSKVIRKPKVLEKCGFSKSTLHLRIQGGEFPEPISLGGRSVGWIEAEVDNWIDEKAAEREVANVR